MPWWKFWRYWYLDQHVKKLKETPRALDDMSEILALLWQLKQWTHPNTAMIQEFINETLLKYFGRNATLRKVFDDIDKNAT